MTLAVTYMQLGVLHQRRLMLAVGKWNEMVGVTLPEVNRYPHVTQMETPGLAEQDEVVYGSPQAPPTSGDQIVEKHGLHFRTRKHVAISSWRQGHEQVEDW